MDEDVPHLDESVDADLSDLSWTDGPGLLLFWALAVVVFLQFFSRYVLNDSIGWTEEIARYLLIGVTFVGAVTVTRKGTHIAVELLYVYLPRGARRVLSTVIDVVLIGVYAWFAWLAAKLSLRTNQLMVSIDVPKSAIYWVVVAALVVMAVYQALRARHHWRHGVSSLIDPPGGEGR
jgi:TRAP-type C4-dicarboxylate transport system permease small subunit